MAELLTAAQMRAIEEAAMASGEVTGLQLMERAGRGVVEAIFDEWPELATSSHRAVVLCGPGNNGGDGFVVARRLCDKGWEVEVLFWGDAQRLPPDARTNYDLWRQMGDVHPLTVEAAGKGDRPALLVDALFGIGCSRAIPLECAQAFRAVEKRQVTTAHPWHQPYHTVAIDCPSGLDCDSGSVLLPAHPGSDVDVESDWRWWKEEAEPRLLFPHLVVTFHRRKLGHVLGAPIFKVRTCDIGIGAPDDRHPASLLAPRSKETVTLLEFDPSKARSRAIWPLSHVDKARGPGDHKYAHGHALVLTGGMAQTGAARLAARGALRIGAGLVTLGAPASALMEVASQITALMARRIDGAEALTEALQDDRLTALCLGPGLGLTRARDFIPAALSANRPTVLDADALTAFEEASETLFALLHETCVLTPHGGEFKRLFPDIAAKLSAPATTGPAYSKVDATRDAAARAGCTVLFKGPDTVIASPGGTAAINASHYDRAAPWLATAGSGDVLAGFITGLLARGLPPQTAAETAAWLHTECALQFGPGLIAEDLPETLPKVLKALT